MMQEPGWGNRRSGETTEAAPVTGGVDDVMHVLPVRRIADRCKEPAPGRGAARSAGVHGPAPEPVGLGLAAVRYPPGLGTCRMEDTAQGTGSLSPAR